MIQVLLSTEATHHLKPGILPIAPGRSALTCHDPSHPSNWSRRLIALHRNLSLSTDIYHTQMGLSIYGMAVGMLYVSSYTCHKFHISSYTGHKFVVRQGSIYGCRKISYYLNLPMPEPVTPQQWKCTQCPNLYCLLSQSLATHHTHAAGYARNGSSAPS